VVAGPFINEANPREAEREANRDGQREVARVGGPRGSELYQVTSNLPQGMGIFVGHGGVKGPNSLKSQVSYKDA
jgi:hypothetical protein